MIEILNEGTLTEREETKSALPKNIRQIGDLSGDMRVYIEDYVMTYIKQLAAYGSQKEEALILYGSQEQIEDTCCYFVSGAVKVAEINSPLYNILFNQEDWKKINEEAALFFPSLSVLGWALLSMDEEFSSGYRVKATEEEFFGRQQPVFIEYSKTEKEEKVYLYRSGMMRHQSGHYIYYDKNEQMQNYMISRKEIRQQEEPEEQLDHATRQFRMVATEKREKRKKQRVSILLYSTAVVMALVVILSGFTMLSNYEKMQSMEKVLFQIADGTSMENQNEDELLSLDARLREIETAETQKEDVTSSEEAVQASGSNLSLTSAAQELAGGEENVQETAKGKEKEEETDAEQQPDATSEEAAGQKADADKQEGINPQPADAAEEKAAEQQPADAAEGKDAEQQPADAAEGKDAEQQPADAAEGKDAEQQPAVAEEKNAEQPSGAENIQQETSEQKSGSEQAQSKEAAASTQETAAAGVQQASEKTETADGYQIYLIKKGDTLEKINRAFYGNVNRIEEICRLNQIENRDSICYGRQLKLPL